MPTADPAEAMMALIEPGEVIASEQTVKIHFAGREHFVRTCVGSPRGDCILWISQQNEDVEPETVRQRFLRAACATAIVNNNAEPQQILQQLASELVDAFKHAFAYLSANRHRRIRQ